MKAALAAAIAAAALTGCGGGPAQAGSAAVIDDQRITVSTLDAAVREWRAQFRASRGANDARANPGSADPRVAPPAVEGDLRGALSALVTFRIGDEVAKRAKVEVSDGDVDQIVAAMDRQRGARNTTLANGLPVRYTRDLARFFAIRELLVQRVAGGAPAESQQAAQARQVVGLVMRKAAAGMKIKINPRFGTFDPAQVQIGPVAYQLSGTESGIR
ncbi:hypothetical protein ACRB68_20350 [Actinomadura sp. RB68]|uniref:Lipoprotein n=1 Tax=Actinomadura macrotermitis TaxID=2585200 RepID=A0A7K0BS18_9ACTN|nr:hypothetical protein [Actinomadura macrotermitis]